MMLTILDDLNKNKQYYFLYTFFLIVTFMLKIYSNICILLICYNFLLHEKYLLSIPSYSNVINYFNNLIMTS